MATTALSVSLMSLVPIVTGGLLALAGTWISGVLNLRNAKVQHRLKVDEETRSLRRDKLERFLDLLKQLDEVINRPQQMLLSERNSKSISIASEMFVITKLHWRELEAEGEALSEQSRQCINLAHLIEYSREHPNSPSSFPVSILDKSKQEQQFTQLCNETYSKVRVIWMKHEDQKAT